MNKADNAIDILTVIKVHGLAIRQIPEVVISRYTSYGKVSPGDQLVLLPWAPHEDYDRLKRILNRPRPDQRPDDFTFVFDDEKRKVFRHFGIRTSIPKYAGWWMCQQMLTTDSKPQWSFKHDHLAPTLEESIQLYLSNLNPNAN